MKKLDNYEKDGLLAVPISIIASGLILILLGSPAMGFMIGSLMIGTLGLLWLYRWLKEKNQLYRWNKYCQQQNDKVFGHENTPSTNEAKGAISNDN